MDDDVIVIYDEIEEEPEQFTAQNYEYMLAQALLTREAIQEKLQDPSESSNFQFVGSATHNNSIWNNFLAVTYGGVEQNFFKCRDCNEIFDKDPQKSLAQLRSHNCHAAPVKIKTDEESTATESNRSIRGRSNPAKSQERARILSREELAQIYSSPTEKHFIVTKSKPNFKCFAWQFLDVVLYKGLKQPFARCRYCGLFVSYTNKNGTSSIRKHALRCPHILRAKRGLGKQSTKSNTSQNIVFEDDAQQSTDESFAVDSKLIPEVEIYSEDDEDDQEDSYMEPERSDVFTCAQLRKLYSTNKDSKAFLFRKSKRKDLKSSFWNWLDAVFYKEIKQDCYRCTICEAFISGEDENELAVHITNHNVKNQGGVKKVVPCKKEKILDSPAEIKPKTYLKKHSPKVEQIDFSEIEVVSETLAETTNVVTHSLIDFVVGSCGQSLAFVEDPSFRSLAQSLIRLGAIHGDRNANDFFPSVDSILKQSIPMRVRALKAEIRELIGNEPHLSLSVDLMKDESPHSNGSSTSYLTVKVHVVTKCFTSRAFVLGAIALRDAVTSESVQDAFLSITKEYLKTDNLRTRCIVVLNENNETLMKAFEDYTRLPSVTHSLEMIVNEVLQVEDTELNISHTVVKIQELFNHITTEHNYAITKGECLLDLLEEFYEMNKPIEKLLKETRPCQRNHSALSDIPKNTVKTILNGFQVIKLCVDTIRQNQITINGILLWKKKLIEQYSPVLYEHRQNARLKFHTLELIQSKFLIDHPIYKIALFLNPNFKSLKFLSEADRQEVFNSIKEIFLSRFRDGDIEADCDKESEAIDKEINRYYITKSFDYANEDLLEFWKKITLFPRLKTIARHILSIPGTSDGVSEELFQKANRSISNGIGTSADYNSIIFLHSNSVDL